MIQAIDEGISLVSSYDFSKNIKGISFYYWRYMIILVNSYKFSIIKAIDKGIY